MAVILIIGGGIGLVVSFVSSLFVMGVQWLVESRSGTTDALLLFARNRIIIDANALVDWVGVAVSACPAALSH